MPNTPGKYADHVCVDISYVTPTTVVSSDLCYDRTTLTSEYRTLLHAALDEWLDKANGTGQFRIWHEDI